MGSGIGGFEVGKLPYSPLALSTKSKPAIH